MSRIVVVFFSTSRHASTLPYDQTNAAVIVISAGRVSEEKTEQRG